MATPILWTLSYALPSAPGTWIGPATLASLGIARPRRRLVSQAASTLSFRLDGAAVDAAYLFPFGTLIQLFRNGMRCFYGIVTQTPGSASGRAESQDYVVSDPWWYLENMVFQQQWVRPSYPGANTTNDPFRSWCFLNQWTYNAVGNYFSRTPTDQQIAQVITFATTGPSTVPIQIGNGIPSMDIPFEEVRDVTCAEVIRKQLRWMPDAVTWFDYTTTPPTLNAARRADLNAVSIAFPTATAPSPLAQFDLNPRYDLYHEAVKVSFSALQSVTVGSSNATWLVNTPYVYPTNMTGREVTALCLSVSLEGLDDTVMQATINVGATSSATPGSGASGTDLVTDGWWLAKVSTLSGYTHAYLQSLSFATSNGSGLPLDANENEYSNELISGQITPWMGYSAQECTVTAVVLVEIHNPAPGDPAGGPYTGTIAKQGTQTISCKVQMTNAPAGQQTLYSLAHALAAETIPANLAQQLYESVGFVPYDGSITLIEAECSGLVAISNTLNLTGSQQPAWATMYAVVQETEEELETGTTTVKFGPPGHLGAPDLVELLRLNRLRYTFTNPATQVQSAQVGAQNQLGQQTAIENTTPGPSTYTQFAVTAQPVAGTNTSSPVIAGGAAVGSGSLGTSAQIASKIPQVGTAPNPGSYPAKPDPAQGWMLARGASLALSAVQSGDGNTPVLPANASLPAAIASHAATTDPNAWVLLRTCDLMGSDGNYHPLYAQEVSICIGGTTYSTMILCSAPFTPGY